MVEVDSQSNNKEKENNIKSINNEKKLDNQAYNNINIKEYSNNLKQLNNELIIKRDRSYTQPIIRQNKIQPQSNRFSNKKCILI